MEIASDRVKDAANLQKHGVSLADAVHLDWSSLLIATKPRRDYGEDRYQGFGVIGGRLYFVAFRPVTTPCGLSASEKQITGRYTTMSKTKLGRNTPGEEAAINRGIAADPDAAAPSTQEIKALRPFPEVTAERRMGRPPK